MLCDRFWIIFIQHTQSTASGHQLVGWVQNTSRGTVVGVVQGPQDKVNTMWVSKKIMVKLPGMIFNMLPILYLVSIPQASPRPITNNIISNEKLGLRTNLTTADFHSALQWVCFWIELLYFVYSGRSGYRALVVLGQELTAVSSRERRSLTEQNTPHSTFANKYSTCSISNHLATSMLNFAHAKISCMVLVVNTSCTLHCSCMNIIIKVIN